MFNQSQSLAKVFGEERNGRDTQRAKIEMKRENEIVLKELGGKARIKRKISFAIKQIQNGIYTIASCELCELWIAWMVLSAI